MTKIVVANFTTLIDAEEAISTATMLQIEQIRHEALFVVTTSKSYQEVLNYNTSFPFIDYIISLNGAYLYNVNQNKCLYQKKIATKTLNNLKKLFPEEEITYFTDDLNNVLQIALVNNPHNVQKLETANLDINIYEINKQLFLTSSLTSKSKCLSKITSKKSPLDIYIIANDSSDISLLTKTTNIFYTPNMTKSLSKKLALKKKTPKSIDLILQTITKLMNSSK